MLQRRVEMSRTGGIDWAFGELLALGSIAMDGRLVRFAGQDTRRGTFVQRHSVLIDHHTGAEYQPLQHLSDDQGRVLIYDSALTEYAALGFEYGYSVANRDALVIWEAQFGDFVNGAQSIIDEYLSSGEAKWGQQSGVVLLLPHGHEGQGPGPHLRTDRTVPAALRRRIHDRRRAIHPGQLLPPAPQARPERGAPPNGGVHPEIHAAQQGRRLPRRRLHHRQVRTGHRRHHRRPGRCPHRAAHQRQIVLRTGRLPRHPPDHRHRDPAPRAALPRPGHGGSNASCRPTPTSPISAGCRKNPQTREHGPSWASHCPS